MTSAAMMRTSLVMKKGEEERGNWDKHIEFLLALLGYCVGFGNVWRFPFRAYENGGAAFLFPYLIMMFIIGKPLFFIESILGQFLSLGPVATFGMIPVLKGVGMGMVVTSFYFCIYYIMYMVYTTKFLYYSWLEDLPWKKCYSWWEPDENCFVRGSQKPFAKCNATDNSNYNETEGTNCTKYGPETVPYQFWNKHILHRTRESRLEVLGKFRVDLAGILFVNWLVVFACLVRGIKSSGKVVYFTALFPYVVLIVMAVFGCTLPGALEGLRFLFVPKFHALLDLKVWQAALTQMFFSLGLGIGGIIMCSSYNKFENKVHWDAMFIASIDFLSSVLASTAIFTTVGFLAHELKVDVTKVVTAGPGLMFVVIPEAIVLLPYPEFCSFAFFLMVYTLGLDSEFVMLETIITTMKDEITFFRKHKVRATLLTCFVCFLFGLPFCTEGGFHLVDFYDSYSVDISLVYAALATVIIVCFFYGLDRFSDDIEFMLGFKPVWWYWKMCWCFIDPIILSVMLVSGIINMGNSGYDLLEYEDRIKPAKWFLAWSPVLITPLGILVVSVYYWKKLHQFRAAFRIPANWGPADPLLNQRYQIWLQSKAKQRALNPSWFDRLIGRCSKKPKDDDDEGSVEEVMNITE